MSYFVSADSRITTQVVAALSQWFGDRAVVGLEDGVITLEVKGGFPDKVDRLSEEQLQMGVCGGGYTQGLNGQSFTLIINKTQVEI